MYSSKILLAAACLAVSGLASGASAAPFNRGHDDHRGQDSDHRGDRDNHRGHETRRPYAARERVYDTLRFHHYRGLGEPEFRRGHYVVRGLNRFGRSVFIEIDPYTGAFIGEFRI